MKITLFLLATVMTAVVYGGLIDDVKHRVAWEAYKVSKNANFFFFSEFLINSHFIFI